MYTKKEHIHFIGIGGIGMSALAIILKQQGYTVSGCDPDITQPTIPQLEKKGCVVYHGNNTPLCNDPSIDVVVYIPMYATTIAAVTAEINCARLKKIPVISRAQMLAELMRKKYSIAIAGSHGKTTTSSLISHILIEAHKDPIIAVGGHLKNINSHARMGSGDFLVAEADESDRSFLDLVPTLAVITNIDLEHLETYTDLDDIKRTFMQFMQKLPFYGKAIVCNDDENIRSLLQCNTIQTITYGIEQLSDFYAKDIVMHPEGSTFSIFKKNTLLGTIELPLAGKHNIYNTLAAIAIADEIMIDFTTIQKSISSFAGVERRFSFIGTYKNCHVFDDYGHHPKEIAYTLSVARQRTNNNLIVVFQPHRYTRTEKLWDSFLSAFSQNLIDTLIITDIYSAGEYPIPTITSKRLVEELKSLQLPFAIHYIPFTKDFNEIIACIDESIAPHDLLLFLGAGKTNQIAEKITKTLI